MSGCNQVSNSLNTEKNKFIGEWVISEINSENITNFTMTYIFSSDGKLSILEFIAFANGTWDVKNGKLVLTLPVSRVGTYGYPYSYQFSNNDRNLSLTPNFQGTSFKLTKQ